MGGLGDHAGEMIYILLAVLLIVAVMAIVMVLMKTGKKSTNQKTAELTGQVAEVDNQFFEDWDMGTCNGAQMKQFLKSAKDKNCAVLVQTLGLLGNQPIWKANDDVASGAGYIKGISSKTYGGSSSIKDGGEGNKETTFNGTALSDAQDGLLPVVMIDFVDANVSGSHKVGVDDDGAAACKGSDASGSAFPLMTALRTTVYNGCLVNYGTILKNAVRTSGTDGDNYQSILKDSGAEGIQGTTGITAMSWDGSNGDKSQTIAFLDGRFHTKQEFAVSQAGINLRYDSTMDLGMSGKTMYVDDNAKFVTYVLDDGAGKHVGVVFIEKK